MKEEIFVECKGLSIGYHEGHSVKVPVKSNISLRAPGGAMVALIGGNGIGKSTLLKTIAGFQFPLSGELMIHQRAASSYSSNELAREMSFVSTEIVRVANLTVREMVGLGRFPYTGWFGQLNDNDQLVVDKSINQVGLSGYENRPVNRISDGERQRAMIARALAQDTRIIILDEPTAFLDISNKYEIVRILHNLAEEQGKCIIYSTHDLNTALSVTDRIWLMLEDKAVEGIPEEIIFSEYLSGLFPNHPHLLFDPEKGDFRIRKEKKGTINLSATGQQLQLASRALERIGFEVIPVSPVPRLPVSPVQPIEVTRQAEGWRLIDSGNEAEFDSLEKLCLAVKQFRLRPQP